MSELLPQNDIREWLNVRESLTGTNLKSFFMLRCAQAHLSPESSADQLQSVLEFPLEGATLEGAEYVLDHLNNGLLDATPEDIASFSTACRAIFTLATAFRPPQTEETVPR